MKVKRGFARNLLIPRKMAGIVELLSDVLLICNCPSAIEHMCRKQRSDSDMKFGLISPLCFCFTAYMTAENEIKHKELIEYRIKAKESGVTEDGPYISFNSVKTVQLLQVGW